MPEKKMPGPEAFGWKEWPHQKRLRRMSPTERFHRLADLQDQRIRRNWDRRRPRPMEEWGWMVVMVVIGAIFVWILRASP